MAKFQPSEKSLDATTDVRMQLRYICRAAELVAQHLEEGHSVPSWVQERVLHSARLTGSAAAYVRMARSRKTKRKLLKPAKAKSAKAKPTKAKPTKPVKARRGRRKEQK